MSRAIDEAVAETYFRLRELEGILRIEGYRSEANRIFGIQGDIENIQREVHAQEGCE